MLAQDADSIARALSNPAAANSSRKYVEKPEVFGADWLVRLSIAPVIGLPWG
jgi:hypothetical protein